MGIGKVNLEVSNCLMAGKTGHVVMYPIRSRVARFSGKIYAKIEFHICQKYAKFQDPTKRVKSSVLLHIIVK